MASTRRLAAILAADVAGYSRLMGADEEGTLQRLKAHRRQLIDPKIAEHRGRIVKTTGDGMLVEFSSVVDAVRSAAEIQRAMADRDSGMVDDQRIKFRIGINLGDVIVEDSDIFGDGVNVAARLEALAEPGGICISRMVRDQIRDKLPYGFEDLGEQSVKNIARPVRAYAMRAKDIAALPVSDAPAALVKSIGGMLSAAETDPNSAGAPRLSIVVLPFTSMSPDPEQEYFADGITEDLTTDLSRIEGSFVIARSTAFTYKGKAVDVRQVARELGIRYVLEGSVRRMGDRVQVNVQLIDGLSGSHVWAERFDTDCRDLAEAQSHITARLARSLYTELVRDIGRIEQERTAHPDPRDLVMRARARLWFQTSASDVRARAGIIESLERALILDPASVDARVLIASILVNDILDGLSSAVEQDTARAELLISEALELDGNHSEGRRIMGNLRRAQGRWAEAQVELETSIALNPNDAQSIRQLGQTLAAQGKVEAAIPYLEKAIRIDLRHRYVFIAYVTLGRCYLSLGRTDEAMDLFRKARALNPGMWYVHLDLAGALGLVGNLEEAKSEIAEAVKLKPEINSIARWRALTVKQGANHPQLQALREKTTYAGLRAAGFPEE
jgi:TolB-like protein/class 3 adenylate cyclase/Flp pilus assembly protein TadD